MIKKVALRSAEANSFKAPARGWSNPVAVGQKFGGDKIPGTSSVWLKPANQAKWKEVEAELLKNGFTKAYQLQMEPGPDWTPIPGKIETKDVVANAVMFAKFQKDRILFTLLDSKYKRLIFPE